MPKGVYERNSNVVDATEAPQNEKDVIVPLEGSIDALVREVEVTGNVVGLSEKAASLAFMEEPVRIFLHETTNPTDELYVFCSVNGEPALRSNPYLKRGGEYTIKRKFVNVLANARMTSYSQPYAGTNDARSENILRPHVSMKYPFSVIEDQNPKGVSWLRSVMAK
jgi:hypothetical protein